MQYNDEARLDSSQVRSSGRGGGGRRKGGIALGGGAGIVVLIVALLLGVNPGDLTSQVQGGQQAPPAGGQGQRNDKFDACKSGADIADNRDCRWVAYTNSIQDYWGETLKEYKKTQVVTFDGQTSTACGTASSAVGPFYCPPDQIVYLDTGFFDVLTSQLGAKGGDAAEAYVIAHEFGHHVQNLTGQMSKAQDRQTGPKSNQVRLELQADCYAGAWLSSVNSDADGPITKFTQDDLDRAVDAAIAVGDDRIQERSQGRVDRESWTHGSSKQRRDWLAVGFKSGDPNQCDTFASAAKI